MIIHSGSRYMDRDGRIWRVVKTNGQRIAPITAGRWVRNRFQTRTFQTNGRYWPDRTDRWDLISEVSKEQ